MPKEGKNQRFARKVCESLAAQFGATFEHVREPVHVLRQKTSFGYQGIEVYLWGANAPYRHLEFRLWVWHDKYEAARLRLGMEPTLEGAGHFWQTTGNLGAKWGFGHGTGRWDGNLDEDPTTSMPQIIPWLSEATRKFFDACADLRTIRKLVEAGHNGPLFTSAPWEETVVIDVTLADWKHLKEYVNRKDLPYARTANPKLIEKIEIEFSVNLSKAG